MVTRRGFTLVEVVLAIGLLVVLAAGLVSFVWNLIERRDALSRGARDIQAGTLLIEQLEGDLLGVIAGDPRAGSGVVGTETSVRILSRAVWAAQHADGRHGSDLQATEYAFTQSGTALTARRWRPAAQEAVPPPAVVSEHVDWFRLRYLDGTAWRASFDSGRTGRLPGAVEVAIWFGRPGVDAREARQIGREDEGAIRRAPVREPDRVRVISVPDARPAGGESVR